MSAREEVLARVRAALRPAGGGAVTGAARAGADVDAVGAPADVDAVGTSADVDAARDALTRGYRHAWQDAGEVPALLDLLAERIEDYRATVTRTDWDSVPGHVARLLAGASRIVIPADVPPQWVGAAGVEVRRDDPPLSVAELDGVDAVVSGCAVAIAETGTIVLDAGAEQGRRALTLVPDHHICVVRADQVVRGVPEGVARLDPRRPLTWISGPSATSDIELSRVEGVHGPRRLDVLLVG